MGNTRPTWNPRVPRRKIWQLYQNDAKGNRDETLVDDVGLTLLLRVQSCLEVSEAQYGRVKCPECGTVIHREVRRRSSREPDVVKCTDCDWELPWADYRKTFHNKHIGPAGMRIPCEEFARNYPKARTYQEKIILTDTLIHRFHWQMEGHAGQPGATVIIGGKMAEIADFLDELTYGPQSTPGLTQRRDEWREIARNKSYGPTRLREQPDAPDRAR